MHPASPAAHPLNRRRFLRQSTLATAAAAAPLILPSRFRGQNAPSRKITVGVIGCGNISDSHFPVLLGDPEGVRVLAVCDVDRARAEAAGARVDQAYGNRDCRRYGDFRELNRRPDIDAVFVLTPDHWHALIAIDAMRQGKDVYIEKPLTLTIREGRALVDAARRYHRVTQTGAQSRSRKPFRDAAEFVRNDGLGRLQRIEVEIPDNNRHCGATWQPEPVPAGLDWDLWLGPSPWRPYTSLGCHYNFRFIADNACGQITNFGAHGLDIGQWALDMDASGPVEVEGHGSFPSSGLFTNATRVDVAFRYASGVVMTCRTSHRAGGANIRFVGERGWVHVARDRVNASDPQLLREVQGGDRRVRLEVSNHHHDNFFAGVRSRRRPISEAEIGHRTATVCNLGQIAMMLGRRLHWDPVREEFRGDEAANRLCGRAQRAPWSLV